MKNLQFISPTHHIVDSIKAGFAFDQGLYARSIGNKTTIGTWKFQNHPTSFKNKNDKDDISELVLIYSSCNQFQQMLNPSCYTLLKQSPAPRKIDYNVPLNQISVLERNGRCSFSWRK